MQATAANRIFERDTVERAEQMLESLVDGALMNVTGVDHKERLLYRLHDLVYLLAEEFADNVPPEVRTPPSLRPWAHAASLMATGSVRLPSMLGRPSGVCQ
jgi:hypothetical protein